MHDFGTDFLYQTTPTAIVKRADGRLEVGREGKREGGE